ncbi:MAG: undecaprenyldiphospho-muramoylpentapeptide beta-N-acetylglucosaminyltransferase [Actinomycetaceae bacterium]|nr:undecaprenyldiphospho-muramoylpentapeptide beta-N-acetylglucosaminyltransferase [Actinomycetaceae bacterium]
MSSQSPHFLLAGGGTAGHVNPLLATAKKLQDLGGRVSVLGAHEGLENELVPAAGLPLRAIDRVSAPRKLNKQALTFPARLQTVVSQTKKIVDELQPDVIVGFGGYVSAPAYLVGRQNQLPVVIHEQNARPGVANKLGALWAQTVAVTFPGTPLKAKRGRACTTGLPLREEIEEFALADRAVRQERQTQARAQFGLDPHVPTVVITGGSLGAQRINESVAAAASEITAHAQVLHLTGKGKSAAVEDALSKVELDHPWVVREYCHDMVSAYAAADLVICRAGAGTVAELSALGLPAVYVPLAIGNGEQHRNAASHVDSGGAALIANSDFDAATAGETICGIIANPHRLESMRQESAKLGGSNASEEFAKLCMEAAGKGA